MNELDKLMMSKWVAFVFGCLNGFFGFAALTHGDYFWAALCIFLSLYCFRSFYFRG